MQGSTRGNFWESLFQEALNMKDSLLAAAALVRAVGGAVIMAMEGLAALEVMIVLENEEEEEEEDVVVLEGVEELI